MCRFWHGTRVERKYLEATQNLVELLLANYNHFDEVATTASATVRLPGRGASYPITSTCSAGTPSSRPAFTAEAPLGWPLRSGANST